MRCLMTQVIGTGGEALIMENMKQPQRLLVIPSMVIPSMEEIIDTIRL